MKQLLIIGLILISFKTYSQTGIDSTTTWTYSFSNFGIIEPDSLYINGDTIINGIKWFHLAGDGSCAFANPDSLPYIREEESKWLIYDVNREAESLLYDFNLEVGDSYIVETFGPNFPIDVRIDSVTTITIDGNPHKVQYCSNPIANMEGFFFAFEVIEGIGSTGYLFPQGNICDPHTGPIRCFTNNNEFVDFDLDRDCDEVYILSNTENLKDERIVEIYPNPVSVNGNLEVISSENIIEIELLNINGKAIIRQKPNTNVISLKLPESGFYVVLIKFKDKVLTKNIIVTNE